MMAALMAEDRQLLTDAVRRYAGERCTVDERRRLCTRPSEAAELIRHRWKDLAQLGWTGLLVPESFGGGGAGLAAVGIVLEELGRHLTVSPLLETGVLAVDLILACGSDRQRGDLLPAICAGDLIIGYAHDETARFRRTATHTTAERRGSGFRLTGTKRLVPFGQSCDQLMVSAAVTPFQGVHAWFLVEPDAPGVVVRPATLLDGQVAADITFDGVALPAEAALGGAVSGEGCLDVLADRGAIARAAEMLGGLSRALAITLEHLRDRRQFGVPIGAFQALQHEAARLYCEEQLCRAIVEAALEEADRDGGDVARLACIAKGRLSDAFVLVAEQGVQLHGGMGVTDEADIGYYMKRSRVLEHSFGDGAYHRDRYATLEGY